MSAIPRQTKLIGKAAGSAQVINDFAGLDSIPKIKLETIFSPVELDAIFQKARNERPMKQHIYRARKKYALFKELFDIQLTF